MNATWLTIAGASLSVFGVIGIGGLTRQLGWLTEQADRSLLDVTIRLLLPCLIFATVSRNEALREPGNLLLPPVVGFVSILLGLAAAAVLTRLPNRWLGLTDDRQRRTFVFAVGVYNFGFLAIPLVQQLFGSKALGVLFIHNLGVSLAFWTFGMALLAGRWDRRWWRPAVNPPALTIVVALLVNYLGLGEQLPRFLTTSIGWLGQAAIPMSLILVGATIAEQLRPDGQALRAAESAKIVAWSVLLRLGLLPVAFLAVALLVPGSLELRHVIVVEAAMPSAVLPIVLARHHGGDAGTALRVALGTSLVGLITIPLWIATGLYLLKLFVAA